MDGSPADRLGGDLIRGSPLSFSLSSAGKKSPYMEEEQRIVRSTMRALFYTWTLTIAYNSIQTIL